MNAQQVLDFVSNTGLKLACENDKLIINGNGDRDSSFTPELRALLVKWKPKLIELLKPKALVLQLVIDGKRITCIDPVSRSFDEANVKQRARWGERLTAISLRHINNCR